MKPLPPEQDMRDQVVLRVTAKMLIPYILIFGFYVVAHGEVGPGGGFQGGVIIASGYILYSLVFGAAAANRALPRRWVESIMALGVLFYASIGVLGFFRGNAFLDYRALTRNMATAEPIGMTLVEVGVGFTVASVMITVFNMITEPADEPDRPAADSPASGDRR